MQGHDEIVWAVEIHDQRLFSASADKTIRVWDIASKRCEQVIALLRFVAHPQNTIPLWLFMWTSWAFSGPCLHNCAMITSSTILGASCDGTSVCGTGSM